MNKQLHNPKYRKEQENRLKENNESVFSKTQQEKINSFWLVYDRDMYEVRIFILINALT